MASAEQINPLLLHLLLLGREQPHFPKTFRGPFSCFSTIFFFFFFPNTFKGTCVCSFFGKFFVQLENPKQTRISYKSQPQETLKSRSVRALVLVF